MSETRLDIGIGSSGAVSGANAVNRAVNEVKTNFIDLAAKVFVAQQALTRVWSSAKEGAAFTETMGRLNRQMGQFHGTAQTIIGDMDRITNSTLGVERAAQMASRGLAIGFNPDQIKMFLGLADQLDDVMGTDLPSAFNEIIQATISGRSQILGNIGVFIDLEKQVQRLAVATNRSTEEITKQERAQLVAKAAAEQQGNAVEKLSTGVLSNADKLKQVEKRWADFWTEMKTGTQNAVVDLVAMWDKLAAAMGKMPNLTVPGGSFAPFGQRGFSDQQHPHGNDPKAHAEHLAITQATREAAEREHNDITQRTRDAKLREHNDIVSRTFGAMTPEQKADAFIGPRRGVDTGQFQGPFPLSPQFKAQQLEGKRDLGLADIDAALQRTMTHLQAQRQVVEANARSGMASQLDTTGQLLDLQRKEIEAVKQANAQKLQTHEAYYGDRRKIEMQSTGESITLEVQHAAEVKKAKNAAAQSDAELAALEAKGLAEMGQIRKNLQVESGKAITEAKLSEYQMSEDLRQREMQDLETWYAGQQNLAVTNYESDSDMAKMERALLREQLAFKLRLTKEEADALLFLKRVKDDAGVNQILQRADGNLSSNAKQGILGSASAQDVQAMERESGDFFAGWARGMQAYQRNTKEGFGMAQDMARRTAQTMEQGFTQFFFAPMEDGWRGMLDGLLQMTKQAVAQMMAQMMMVKIMTPLLNTIGTIGSSLFSGAKASVPTSDVFSAASGGVGDFGAGAPAILHGREAVVPLPDGRSIPVSLSGRGGGGGVSMPVTIINQHAGADVEARQSEGPGGMMQLEVLVTKAVNRSLNEGRHDKALRSRFGLTPGGG